MNRTPTKPWSMEIDEHAAQTSALVERASRPAASGASDVSPHFGRRPLGLGWKIAPSWALAPLGFAAALTLWGAVTTTELRPGISGSMAACIFLFEIAAGAMLVGSRVMRKRALADMRQAINNGTRASTIEKSFSPLGPELQSVWQTVEQHTANVQLRLVELTEQRRQMQIDLSLAAARKRHVEAVLQSIADPILVTDEFDQLTFANSAAIELFNIKIGDALRRPLDELFHDPSTSAGLVRIVEQVRQADRRSAKRRIEHKIGSRVFELTLAPVNDDHQAPSATTDPSTGSEPAMGHPAGPTSHGVITLWRDVTQEREVSRMKSAFVSQVSHELRTPLSSIRAYVEMLVDGEASDEKTRAEYYDIIQASADRLGRLIDNMLNISRIEAGTVRINKAPVAVAMLVKEAADTLRPQAEQKGLTLAEDLTPVIYRVLADRDLLYQAVLNLLSNAIKYTSAGGQVKLRMTPQEENRRIRIEVSDTGVGIPAEDLPRVFEKFFRVEANKEVAKGTGLGLHLVKQIVESVHGGEVTLASEVGKGSTFGIVLPLVT